MPFTSSLGGGSTRSWGGIGASGGDIIGPPFFLAENLTYQGGTLYSANGETSPTRPISFSMSDDGNHFYLHGQQKIINGRYSYLHYQYDLSANPYKIENYNYLRGVVTTRNTDGERWAAFISRWRPDGLKAYDLNARYVDLGTRANAITEYTASTAYNIQTLSYQSPNIISLSTSLFNNIYNVNGSTVYFAVRGYWWIDDGNQAIVVCNRHNDNSNKKGDTFAIWGVSTPYDLSSTKTLLSYADSTSAKDLDHSFPSNGEWGAAAFANDGKTVVMAMQLDVAALAYDRADWNGRFYEIYTFYIPNHDLSKLKFISRRTGFDASDTEWNTIDDGNYSDEVLADTFPGSFYADMFMPYATGGVMGLDQTGRSMWHMSEPETQGRLMRRWDFID